MNKICAHTKRISHAMMPQPYARDGIAKLVDNDTRRTLVLQYCSWRHLMNRFLTRYVVMKVIRRQLSFCVRFIPVLFFDAYWYGVYLLTRKLVHIESRRCRNNVLNEPLSAE